ncbi:hypothetical protein FOL47_009969 [Perkinsus chesapeaki]|uniref:Phosphodiesterase n=1 Tax=Perkinsus chesapeaki TaxID=330153 RepID=A0A7J6L5J7_PERCH|nr:hypothetical protein FOL47_009969 [Perkinsus chesapeaki]
MPELLLPPPSPSASRLSPTYRPPARSLPPFHGGRSLASPRSNASSVADYFHVHNLERFIADMLCSLGEALPENPSEYMCDYIRNHAVQTSSPSAAAAAPVGNERRRCTTGGQLHLRVNEEADEELNESATYSSSGRLSTYSLRSVALHRVSRQLEKENLSIHSFVQEWIDRPELLMMGRRPSHTSSEETPRKSQGNTGTKNAKSRTRPQLFRKWERKNRGDQNSLEELLAWEYDALSTCDETLAHNALSILDLWGFFDKSDSSVGIAHIDITRMQCFIADLFRHYNSQNPYHNFKHAFSVMTVVGNTLRFGGADEFCTAFEELALLVAALSHDVGHGGLNNDYYVKKKHPLAIRYNDQAVLESMHSALAFELILQEKNNFLAVWTEENFSNFRKAAIAAILATDMKVHFDLTTQMQDLRSSSEVDTSCPDSRLLVHRCIVHAADISNPLLPTTVYEAWAYRVSTEFHLQAEREKYEGLPTTPFMESSPDDRAEFAKLQLGFMNFVVAPLWNAMFDMWPSLENRRHQLETNVEHFKKMQSSAEEEEATNGKDK